MEFLSHDLLEGRAPGTRGGMLAERYVKSLFELLDIQPYGKGYFQPFDLKGYRAGDLSVEADSASLAPGDDVVGGFTEDSEHVIVEGEALFAGYGIVSPDWSWDDYKGASVKDRILIVRVNEPGRTNPELFDGQALTYYGRWTYKLEEAARQGAKGVLLIHTDDSAGYGWHVVKNSWGKEALYLPSSLAGASASSLKFRGWVSEKRLKEILKARQIDVQELYEKSESREFRPTPLGFSMRIEGHSSFRTITANNVVGFIPGSDPRLKTKAVVLSAHIDHLGQDSSLPPEEDQVFNGAVDNASAVAAMIETARILKAYREHLKFSVIVLACEAEEEGLLGSRYFVDSVDPAAMIADINFESTPVWERSGSIMAIGARYSTLEDILKDLLEKEHLKYSTFSMADQGFFYRSDQFSFARRGIPSLWISAGEDFFSGRNRLKEFFKGPYHTPDDEFDPGWPLGSTIQTVAIALKLVDYLNRYSPAIQWKGKRTFPVENRQ